MSRLPSFTRIDLTAFDLSKLPKVELPNLHLSRVDDRVVAAATQAAYLTVGLGVATVERLDTARRAAKSAASDALDTLSAAVSTAVGAVTKRAA